MSAVGGSVEHSAVLQHARQLCLPTVGAEFAGLAEEAARRGQGHVCQQNYTAPATKLHKLSFPIGLR